MGSFGSRGIKPDESASNNTFIKDTDRTQNVRLLLEDSQIEKCGWITFMGACEKGRTEIVRLLLKDSRIDVNKEDVNGWTGFISACMHPHREIVRLLLTDSRIDINKVNKYGVTGFMLACQKGHTETLSLLLRDSRIDVNKGDNDRITGFMLACEKGHAEIVTLLLNDSRIDVNKADNDRKSVFLYACLKGHSEIVSLLLKDSRIDVDQADTHGETPFMHACLFGYGETVRILSESERVDCVCGWKESVDRRCRRLSENVMRDGDEYEEGSLSSVWYNLTRIGMGVFIRGWEGENERMKEVWIYGDRERREENKRSSEMVMKRETEWRRVSDYIFEEDITCVLILCHYSESIQKKLNEDDTYPRDMKNRVLEMESM